MAATRCSMVLTLAPDVSLGSQERCNRRWARREILLGWASELPVLVEMNDLPRSQPPRSDPPSSGACGRPGASAGSGELRATVSKISPRLGSTPGDSRGHQGTRSAMRSGLESTFCGKSRAPSASWLIAGDRVRFPPPPPFSLLATGTYRARWGVSCNGLLGSAQNDLKSNRCLRRAPSRLMVGGRPKWPSEEYR
jgi:hypothetical protein